MIHEPDRARQMGGRFRFVAVLVVILALAALVRGLFPLADPPADGSAGVVWHDEGAWVHNARNRVLFGGWIQDEWNPIFITPVLTGLEYVSFQLFGVGLWQARLVSQVLGASSVLALGAGVARLATPPVGLIAAALLATNYTYVMYDRAAVMEGTMVAFLVIAWWCYVRAQDRPVWGSAAAVAALLAYFSKATAVFFVVSLGLDALVTVIRRDRLRPASAPGASAGQQGYGGQAHARIGGAVWTLSALFLAGLAALAIFVVPYWDQYRFYNWETSVTRRPSYSALALRDRLTWFPIIHDFFTRMWLVTLLALGGLFSALTRVGGLKPGERLLIWWIGLGTLELLVRDVGNERYFVYLIPPLVALAALVLGRDRRLLAIAEPLQGRAGLLMVLAPVLLFALYVVTGSAVRLAFFRQIRPAVRLSAAVAALLTIGILATWPRVPRALSRFSWSVATSVAIVGLVVALDLAQFGLWAAGRSYKNYEAMRSIAESLPPGTLVHGKLANGLALESQIRPIFVGRGFGNYRDRLTRDDVPFILTQTAPRPGYEGSVILEVLAVYPQRRVLRRFEVADTPDGRGEAALIEKWPGAGMGKKRSPE